MTGSPPPWGDDRGPRRPGPPRRPAPPRRDARGRIAEGPVPIGAALGELAERIGAGQAEVVGVVFGKWAEVVGEAVAAHVRPLRLDGPVLVLSADHPAWATQIRHLAPEILERLKRACSDAEAPARLEVRVRR